MLLKENNVFMFGTHTAGMKDIATVYDIGDKYKMLLTTKQYVDKEGKEIDIKFIDAKNKVSVMEKSENIFSKQLKDTIDIFSFNCL